MTFWIIIFALALIITATLALAARRGQSRETEAAAYDLRIYRDQLAELDRDLARGVISDDEAARVRVEVSRRILAADAQLRDATASPRQPSAATYLAGAAALAIVFAGSVLLYRTYGQPSYPDRPIAARLAASNEARANRMTQTEAVARLPPAAPPQEANAEFLELMERLRATVADRPGDIQGLALLARNEAALGNMSAAIDAQRQIIALREDAATAADHSFLAELMIGEASGYVSVEAETALRRALELDPRFPFARYYLAQYLMQVDRPDAAFRTLKGLLEESTPDAPWVDPIREQIEEVAWRAGVSYELPPQGAPGPDAEAMAAAQDMSAEERNAMIRGMVDGLSQRLASEGGPPEEWARLIRALGVLDDKATANEIWTEAKQVFAGDQSALRRLYSAAQDAEIAQ